MKFIPSLLCFIVIENKQIRMRELISDIFNKEGIRGFFRGFYFSIFSGGLANILFFSR